MGQSVGRLKPRWGLTTAVRHFQRGTDAIAGRHDPGGGKHEPMGQRVCTISLPWSVATTAGLFLLALLLFHILVPGQWSIDHAFHIHGALGLRDTPLPVPHPLFHYTVAAAMYLTGAEEVEGAERCAVVLLALAVALRGWLTYRELGTAIAPAEAAMTCLLLTLAMALPNRWKFPAIYLGQIQPNVWHNPTAVLAAPLAVLTFLAAMRYWDAPDTSRASWIAAWSALCALAKPNYLLAFFPCFGPVMVVLVGREMWRGRLSARQAVNHLLAAFALPALTLGCQFLSAFGGETRVVYEPFAIWKSFSPNIPASVLLGVAFPVTVAVLYPLNTLKDRRLVFSWCVLAVTVALFALFAETPRQRGAAGNFGWGMVPASYLLFVESCRLVGRQPGRYRALACSSVLALHAGSGTFYLVRCLISPGACVLF